MDLYASFAQPIFCVVIVRCTEASDGIGVVFKRMQLFKYKALWTSLRVACASHQGLLGVISSIGGDNRKPHANGSVSTYEVYPIGRCVTQRPRSNPHDMMKNRVRARRALSAERSNPSKEMVRRYPISFWAQKDGFRRSCFISLKPFT